MKIAVFGFSWHKDRRPDPFMERVVDTFLEFGIDVDFFIGNSFTNGGGIDGLSPKLDCNLLRDFLENQNYELILSFNNALITEKTISPIKTKVVSWIIDDFNHLFRHDTDEAVLRQLKLLNGERKDDLFKTFRLGTKVIISSHHLQKRLIDAVPEIKARLHLLPTVTQVQEKSKRPVVVNGEIYPIAFIGSFLETGIIDALYANSSQGKCYSNITKQCIATMREKGRLYFDEEMFGRTPAALCEEYGCTQNMFERHIQNTISNQYRVEAVEKLSKYGLVLFGNVAWVRALSCSRGAQASFRPEISLRTHDELMNVYNSSKLCINIPQIQCEKALPFRVLDIMASKGLLITKHHEESDIFDFFGKDCPVVMYKDIDDLERLCRYYLENEEERLALVAKCNALVAKGFSFQERCSDILRIGNVNIPGSSARKGVFRSFVDKYFRKRSKAGRFYKRVRRSLLDQLGRIYTPA